MKKSWLVYRRKSLIVPLFRVNGQSVGDEFTVYVEDQLVFTKKITYYLTKGRPGFFVGTATDAAFRRIVIEELP